MVDEITSDDPMSKSTQSENGDSTVVNMAAIVLAGGTSNRMGETNKLLLSYGDQTFIQQAVSALIDAGVSEIVVVLGHDSEHTQQQLVDFPVAPSQSLRWVVNADYEHGQMTSVSCGLLALDASHAGVLICLCDQPLISSAHIQQLVVAFKNRQIGKQIVVPFYQEQRGNPVVISESVRLQVMEGDNRFGCRRFIDKNPNLVVRLLVTDAAFVTDIDTPEEYRELNRQRDIRSGIKPID